MNTSKTLTSAVAAAALVGAIGLAYAQTTAVDPATTNPPANSTTVDTPVPPMTTRTPTAPSATTNNSAMPATRTDTMPTERAAQADRN